MYSKLLIICVSNPFEYKNTWYLYYILDIYSYFNKNLIFFFRNYSARKQKIRYNYNKR